MSALPQMSVQERSIADGQASMHAVSDRILRMFETIRDNSMPRVSLDRGVLFTESFKQTEGQPLILRWAKALGHVAAHLPIAILDDELIVGRANGSMSRYGLVYPELDGSLFLDAVDAFTKRGPCEVLIEPEDRRVMVEDLYPYWQNKDYLSAYRNSMPEGMREYIWGGNEERTQETWVMLITAHIRNSQNWFHDYSKPIHRGFLALKEEAKQKLHALSSPAEIHDKAPFYEASMLVCDAIMTFAKRYSQLAMEMAMEEKNHERKAELLTIAKNCAHVPALPARNFYEGLQAQWFTQFFSRLEQNVGGQIGNGRIDQYLYPLYAQDREAGELTREKAQELLQCLWLNMWQSTEVKMSPAGAAGLEGFAHFESVTIGGQTPDGHDAVNELSYVVLESSRPLQCTYPEIGVRYHANMPEAFLHAVAETIKDGKGTPKLLNDDVVIPFYLANGSTYEEALDYGMSGCAEARLCNRETHITGNAGLNYGAVVEMTMRNGRIKYWNNKQFGPESGDPKTFTCYEDLWQAFKSQMLAQIDMMVSQQFIANSLKSRFFAAPLTSSLHTVAMNAGMDLNRHAEGIPGGMAFACIESMGLATAVDSLAAIRQLVFEDKLMSMESLVDALDSDFEGCDTIRQYCLSAPKYGNNIPEVDHIATDINHAILDHLHSLSLPPGLTFVLRCLPVTFHIPMGRIVGATPNGRKAGFYLSEGISASHGMDSKGPTAAMISYAKGRTIGYREKGPDLLNVKFLPSVVAQEEGTRRLCSFIRAWGTLKHWHVQFNIINKATLLDAQKNPDRYRNLVVRVAGYSAYFIQLSTMLQNEIIARTDCEMK